MICRVHDDFVPVSVGAALMHQPSKETERRLLHAIGRSAPAPQGIAVLNSDGRVLSWTLMFDDDPAVLVFLDHALKRYQENPAGTAVFDTERYQRYPTFKRNDVPAHEVAVPKLLAHGAGDPCPAEVRHSASALLAKVVGRRLERDGNLTQMTVNQEDYAQDQFGIPAGLQEKAWRVLGGAGDMETEVPRELAWLWVKHAYLGMLDVRPLDNPAGAPSDRSDIAFKAQADPERPGWFRVSGTSHVAAAQKRRGGDGAGFDHEIQLDWEGWIHFKGERIAKLLLEATGTERLQWRNGQPPGARRGQAEVANLPGGRPIDWEGPVRYGVAGSAVRDDER